VAGGSDYNRNDYKSADMPAADDNEMAYGSDYGDANPEEVYSSGKDYLLAAARQTQGGGPAALPAPHGKGKGKGHGRGGKGKGKNKKNKVSTLLGKKTALSLNRNSSYKWPDFFYKSSNSSSMNTYFPELARQIFTGIQNE
jgi:hypothetical protein